MRVCSSTRTYTYWICAIFYRKIICISYSTTTATSTVITSTSAAASNNE